MGRNSSDHSESPVRNHRSSHRSPLRRERSARSPGRERASRHQKPPTHSPPREKPSSHTRSSKQTRSKSPAARTQSPVRANSRSPSPRSKRLRRDRSNNKDDKSSERGHHESRSPSPRTRRLRRAQADKADEIKDKGQERNHDKVTRKERDSETERHDRKSGRDADGNGNGSSKSRHGEGHRSRHRSDSPPAARGARDEGNNSRSDHQNGNDDDSVAQMKAAEEALATKEKQKPSFELSGKLAAETNRVKGVTLLFTEPPDARKPEVRWRLYVFKGGEVLNEPLYVHRQTCYLFGRERRVADIPTDHPSCSKQHAVLQYRQVEVEQPDGMLAMKIRPYIMDLGSTNGTFINDNRIEAQRYYELMEKDTIKFGNSSREYVILHENSA